MSGFDSVRDQRGRGRAGLDVTGEDVAAFCDERVRGTPSWVDKGRASLNRDVARRLGHPGVRA